MTTNTESFTFQTLHYLMKNKLAVIGGILVLLIFILSIFAPLVAPYDPSTIDIKNILIGPSFSHPLGTDDLGRDVLSRMLWGAWHGRPRQGRALTHALGRQDLA